jgi:L-cysteine desulfidase
MTNEPCIKKHDFFERILIDELIPALGCTEPIAVALAAAKAGEVLGKLPEKVELQCSGNIIKNVKGVIVPNSMGRTGLEIAAAMGFTSGQSEKGLEVLEGLTPEQLDTAVSLAEHGAIRVKVAVGEESLFVRVRAKAGADEVEVVLKKSHNHIASIKKNGNLLFEDAPVATVSIEPDKSVLSMAAILDFARTVDFTQQPELGKVLEQQIKWNSAIADEGIKGHWGAEVGKTILLGSLPEDTAARAKARAAAGSDARMNGCSLPVIINSGSGNQGMTVSLPVIEFARDLSANRDSLYRALIVSNLTSIYQKNYIGRLSAFCGAVSAAAGAGAGIAFLKGMDDTTIGMIVTNTIATIGGMVCDGAKRSCAAKIAMAVETALMGIRMAEQGYSFNFGEGIVGEDVDCTIKNVGRMAKDGMRETDIEILHIMTED